MVKRLDSTQKRKKQPKHKEEKEKCRQQFGDMICGVLKQHSTKAQWNLLTAQILLF
jgi:hypothetical protein